MPNFYHHLEVLFCVGGMLSLNVTIRRKTTDIDVIDSFQAIGMVGDTYHTLKLSKRYVRGRSDLNIGRN